jgi:hypothetical protein
VIQVMFLFGRVDNCHGSKRHDFLITIENKEIVKGENKGQTLRNHCRRQAQKTLFISERVKSFRVAPSRSTRSSSRETHILGSSQCFLSNRFQFQSWS